MSLKKNIASAVGNTPLWRLAEMAHKRPRVLFYHGVDDKPFVDKRIQGNQISLPEFEKQMNFLKKNFEFISIDRFYEMVARNEKFTGNELVLTFDDGYKNNLTVAAPLLLALDIPFTVFIATDCVEKGTRVPTYYIRSAVFNESVRQLDIPSLSRKYIFNNDQERSACENDLIRIIKTLHNQVVRNVVSDISHNLSTEQIEEADERFISEQILSWDDTIKLSEVGATIASHTMEHTVLHANQDEETIREQLSQSKAAIEAKIGVCDFFAFPNGDKQSVCPLSVDLAGETYKMSFAVDGRAVRQDYNINFISRIGVCEVFGAARSQISILSLK